MVATSLVRKMTSLYVWSVFLPVTQYMEAFEKGSFTCELSGHSQASPFLSCFPFKSVQNKNMNFSWLTWDAHEGALLFLTVFPKSEIAKKL